MDDSIPPPPYTLRDPRFFNSALDDTPIPVSSPTYSQSVESLDSDDGISPIPSGTYFFDTEDHATESAPVVSGAPYFAMRVPLDIAPVAKLVHRMTIKSSSNPNNIPFPKPSQKFMERDVTHHDWSAFLKHAFPLHSPEQSESITQSDDKKSRKLTKPPRPGSCPWASSSTRDNVPDQIKVRKQIHSVIKEWNEGFFLPRGVLIVSSFEPLSYKGCPDINARTSTGLTALMNAFVKSDISLIEDLLLQGANPNIGPFGGKGAVYQAAERGDLPILRLLLSYGALPDNKPTGCPTPMGAVASAGNIEVVELLLAYGADVNAGPVGQPNTFHNAAATSNLPLMRLLLAYGTNPDDKYTGGETPLGQAVQRGDLAVIDLCLEHGANVNRKPMGGATPVYRAAERSNLDVLRRLIAKNADISIAPVGCDTALGMAVQRSDSAVAQILVNAGADVNTKPWGGKTPLYTAAIKGDVWMMKLLLGKGAKADVAPPGCPSALSMAISSGNTAVVKLLLEYGADINAKSPARGGDTAYQTAMAHGHKEIRDVFSEYAQRRSLSQQQQPQQLHPHQPPHHHHQQYQQGWTGEGVNTRSEKKR